MMKTAKILIAAAAVLMAAATMARAEIRLPEIIGNHMVLRQNSDVKLWGWAEPGARITVTADWTDASATGIAAADGLWELTIATPAGSMTPHTLTISEADAIKDDASSPGKSRAHRKTKASDLPATANSLTLNDILIGEVWFCSGQSNMEMPVHGFNDCPIEGSAEEIALSGQYKGIRMAKVPKTGALTPQATVSGSWQTCSPENTAWFSATAWYFAKMLHAVLDIPVGIINCAWGGSKVESWLPREIVSGYPDIDCDVKEPAEGNKGWNWHFYTPYIMYNGMIHPLTRYTVSGFLWYQGESNVGQHDTYPQRLTTMVETWRELWGLGELPFYMVELAPYRYGGDGTSGARFREMQHAVAKSIPNAGIICTNDLVYPYEEWQIHPCQKEKVGQRLAYLALNRTYGRSGIVCDSPEYREMKIQGSEAHIYFDNADSGFSPWKDIIGFEIAGEDKVFHEARARLYSNYIVVSSEEVPAPVAVRYCFKDFQIGNLTGTRNLPAVPFRTDDWD